MVKVCMALYGTPSQWYMVSLFIWDHILLPATTPPDSECTPPEPHPDRPVADLPIPEGLKTELHAEMVYLSKASHPFVKLPGSV